jgi:hypothetical protein
MATGIEDTWKTRAENAVCLIRRINLYVGVQVEQVVETACVIAVPMGDRHKVEATQIDPEHRCVLGKRSRVVAGVKKDALSAKFQQRGKAPVFL